MRAALALSLFAVACGRARPREEAAPVPLAPLVVTPKAACTVAAVPLRRATAKRVVAIGDLHGDLAAARAALRTAGAIDERDAWRGGDLVVVQTGDVLDRNDEEQAILDLFTRLEGEAAAAGGALIPLVGNHELMNAAGDFRYVTPGGMRDFGGARAKALEPGGAYAKRLAQHAVVAIVGDTVYSHAGVLGDWVAHVDDANQTARCWLDGQAGDKTVPPAVLTDDNSPVWTRAAGLPTVDCAAVAAALKSLGAARMVVGHTVQPDGISSACDGALWRIDVGLGREYGGPIQVLEVAPTPKILTGTRL